MDDGEDPVTNHVGDDRMGCAIGDGQKDAGDDEAGFHLAWRTVHLRLWKIEGPEQSDHSDAPDLSDDDSFMNLDSPIPSPKAPQDYDSELELPTVEWRSPSPLEHIPDSDLPSTQIGPLLQSVPETEDLADHDEQENGSSAPATMPDAVSSAPTSSTPPGITVTPNL
ncbi:hypothetical protein B0H10DRAFT_1968080 [Mycena sp. CBHHK59/15]|nr:hypothetical protein B0H10DRAFT_1968080 [Mycena sp. CBHHK59/15]